MIDTSKLRVAVNTKKEGTFVETKEFKVDLKNRTFANDTSRSDFYNFCMKCKEFIETETLSSKIITNAIILEFKKMYFESLRDETTSFDLESIKYMDEILFSNLYELIRFVVEYRTKLNIVKSSDDLNNIKDIIKNMVNSTVSLLEYEKRFDHDKFYGMLEDFFEVFS